MELTQTHWRTALGAVLVCALALMASPSLGASVSAPASASSNVLYADMSDAQLTQALQSWGTLESSERRELLVELKKRMERSQEPQARREAPQTVIRTPRTTGYIRVSVRMRFGAGIDSSMHSAINKPIASLRSGGVVVMRGGVQAVQGLQAIGDARLSAQRMFEHMRRLIANSQPLPGPGFGDGFERRQAYLRASFGTLDTQAGGGVLQRASASATASQTRPGEIQLRD